MEQTHNGDQPDMNALPAIVVARRILDLRREQVTTQIQVQKLVYLCHGWMLGLRGEPLIREQVEAWIYGPVIREIYDEYSCFGNAPIEIFDHADLKAEFKSISDDQDKLIRQVVESYGQFDAFHLSALTHREGTPWHKIKFNGKVNGHETVIPNDDIKAYYMGLAKTKDATWQTAID